MNSYLLASSLSTLYNSKTKLQSTCSDRLVPAVPLDSPRWDKNLFIVAAGSSSVWISPVKARAFWPGGKSLWLFCPFAVCIADVLAPPTLSPKRQGPSLPSYQHSSSALTWHSLPLLRDTSAHMLCLTPSYGFFRSPSPSGEPSFCCPAPKILPPRWRSSCCPSQSLAWNGTSPMSRLRPWKAAAAVITLPMACAICGGSSGGRVTDFRAAAAAVRCCLVSSWDYPSCV